MLKYLSVGKEASAEQIIEKSRFIAHIRPVSSREEAEAFIAQKKKEYKDATHNVPVFVIGDKMQLQWGSDDGEPQGTSAAPVVQMLVKEGITNVCIVITRYFGGIKLGTGGLVRAYTGSARLALDAAGVIEVRDFEELEVSIPYNLLDIIKNYEKEMPFEIVGTEYTDNIKLTLRFESENRGVVENMLRETTRGNF
jgi:uncharacterized YigZ family protein